MPPPPGTSLSPPMDGGYMVVGIDGGYLVWMFMIGFVFVFVILKGKIINLKLLYEKSRKLFFFFFNFYDWVWIRP